MKRYIKKNIVKVIQKETCLRVNSPESFIKLWLNPIRHRWLVLNHDHPLAHHPYQYINSPLGNPNTLISYLAGKQCFAHRKSLSPQVVPSYMILNMYHYYQMVNIDQSTQWIQIIDIAVERSSEPLFQVSFRNVYSLSFIFIHSATFIIKFLVIATLTSLNSVSEMQTKFYWAQCNSNNFHKLIDDYSQDISIDDCVLYGMDNEGHIIAANSLTISELGYFDTQFIQ